MHASLPGHQHDEALCLCDGPRRLDECTRRRRVPRSSCRQVTLDFSSAGGLGGGDCRSLVRSLQPHTAGKAVQGSSQLNTRGRPVKSKSARRGEGHISLGCCAAWAFSVGSTGGGGGGGAGRWSRPWCCFSMASHAGSVAGRGLSGRDCLYMSSQVDADRRPQAPRVVREGSSCRDSSHVVCSPVTSIS